MVSEQALEDSITKVWAKNFRSIENAELYLGPLTVLVGPNASGKSNIVDILKFIRDASNQGVELAITTRGGIDSVQRRSPTSLTQHTELGFQYRGPYETVEYSFVLSNKRNVGYGIRRESLKIESENHWDGTETIDIQLSNGRLSESTFTHRPGSRPTGNESVEARNAEYSRWSLGEDFGDQDLVLISNQIPLRRGFVPVSTRFDRQRYPSPSYIGRGVTRVFSSFVNHLNNLSFYRIFPNSLREPQKMLESSPLLEGGENLASTLLEMLRNNSRFLPDLKQALDFIAPGIGDIRVSAAGSYLVVELEHESPEQTGTATWLDLSNESDGTLRLLGLLVALFQQPAPSLFAIEEPEMNVHPGGMAVLMDTIQEATQRGQVIITTHSPDLINLVPVECLRAVSAESGSTKVGHVAEHQLQSVMDGLFSAGELHSMEGLLVSGAED